MSTKRKTLLWEDYHELKSSKDRLKGSLDTIKAKLKEKFSCKTLKTGKAKLDQIIKDRDKLEKEAETLLDEIESILEEDEDD